MEVDDYLKSSIRWMDAILNIANETNARHKWHDTTKALDKVYPNTESANDFIKSGSKELSRILASTNPATEDGKKAARHIVILIVPNQSAAHLSESLTDFANMLNRIIIKLLAKIVI